MNATPLRALFTLALLLFAAPLALAQTATTQPSGAEEDPRHNELRTLRDGLVEAMNKADIDGMLKFCHPQIVYTPQDGTLLEGPQAIRDYSNKMLNGPGHIVEKLTVHPVVDRLTTFYGDDTGIASGSSEDEFRLTDGRNFKLKSRWTASVVKEDGRWLITSLHISSNLFDNPLLDMAKGFITKAAIGGFVFGVILTGIIAWLMRKRSKTA